MLFLTLKALSDSLLQRVCSAFLLRRHLLSFQPFTLLQLHKISKCVRLHYDLCLSTCCLPCLECTQFLLCISSSKKCLRLSQTTLCMMSLCYHIAPFMRSVSWGLSSLSDSKLQIFYSCCILFHCSKFYIYHRKKNRQNSFSHWAPSTKGRQTINKYISDICSAEKYYKVIR